MVRYQFTPAASRALLAAAKWTSGGDAGAVTPAELLLGLLDESESRAAEMLAARGIDTSTVLARWPDKALSPKSKVESQEATNNESVALSPELQDALFGASCRLADFPRPVELATEHLLLGLVAAHDELADWLAERGFDAAALADEICRFYGYGNGKVDIASEGSGFRVQGSDEEPLRADSVANVLDGVPPRTDGVSIAEPRNATEGVPYRTAELRNDFTGVFRLLDAAANRAREGLRVLEDFVRFVWNDRHLTSQLKQLRHDLAAALRQISAADLLASRDTLADVGTELTTEAERDRPDTMSVVTASAKRLQESLRSLEEYGKILSPEMSAQIEQLRYRSYTLERAMAATSYGLTRLAGVRLYVLIDGCSSLPAFSELVQTLVAAGVDILQLRDKRLADRDLLARANRMRELTLGTRTLFIMNDRADLAALARADGVHVGQDELPVAACRAIVGPQALVGVSTHSLEQAHQAVLDGANYIGVGPIFASRTKPFDDDAPRGPELLRAVCAEVSLPAFAIGGIELGNLDSVLATACARIAVSGAVLSADDPGRAARDLSGRLTSAAISWKSDA